MKNVFDFNVNTKEYDGSEFYSRKISPELEEKLAEVELEARGMLKKLALYFVAEMGLIIASVIIVMRLIRDGGLAGLLDFSAKSCAAIGLILVAVVIHFCYINRKNAVIGAWEKGYLVEEEELQRTARNELTIPESYFAVEVLKDPYELVKDWKYLQHKQYSVNASVDVYQRERAICFFDGVQEFEIPIDEIVSVDIIREKKIIEEWLKDGACDKEPYKEYGVRPRRTKNPGYVIPVYYQIRIEHNGQEYEIIIPNYEEEGVRKIVEMVKPYKQ